MSAPDLLDSDQEAEATPGPRWPRWRGWWSRLPGSPNGYFVAALAVVVVAHAPYLIGAFDPNPALTVSGLVRSGKPGWLPGTTTIDPNAGFTSQAGGHRAALDWIAGRIPWWNPWEGMGVPLAGSPSAAAFFLPFVLLTLVPDGQVGIYLVLDLIGCAATWLVLRRLGLAPAVAFAGAVLFGLNGTDAWFRYVADNPVAFLPVMILGVEQVRSSAIERRRGGWALLALGTTFSLLGSFPETALLDGLLVVVWLLVRSLTAGRDVVFTVIRRSALAVVVGVLIAAPPVVAFADYYPHGYLGSHASGALGTATLVPDALVTTVAPYALGPIFGFTSGAPTTLTDVWGNVGGYLTAAVVVLAVVGLVGSRLRALRLALGAFAAILLSRNFGFSPAVHLVLLLPTAGHDAVYRYDNGAIEMAVVVLAALGLDDLARRRSRAAWPVAVGCGAIGLIALAWHEATPLHHALVGPHVRLWWLLSFGWAAATVVVVTACLVIGGRRAMGVAVALVALEGVAMFAVPEASSPRSSTLDQPAVAFLRAHVGTGRFATFGPFAPDYGSYYGVASVDINDLPVPKTTATYDTTQLAPNSMPILFNGVSALDSTKPGPLAELPDHLAGYRQAGVEYLVVGHGSQLPPLPPKTLTLSYSDNVMDVYQLSQAAPYFTASGGCQVSFTSTVRAVTTCPHPAVLLRRETMLPGWTARTGGRTVVPAATGPFQQVDVPAGRSVTTFSFTPPHERLAWLGTLAGVILLLGLSGRRWLPLPARRRAHRRPRGRRRGVPAPTTTI